jgi:hypothetical protein
MTVDKMAPRRGEFKSAVEGAAILEAADVVIGM